MKLIAQRERRIVGLVKDMESKTLGAQEAEEHVVAYTVQTYAAKLVSASPGAQRIAQGP